ncbi:MAG TPA: cytochrome C peroxidase [Polyangiaceae bacterium]|nr:cytochrome C peroxidase [Polyangiaceae bacterium]
MMASPRTLLPLLLGLGLLAGCGGPPKGAPTAPAAAAATPAPPPGVTGQCGRAAPAAGATRYGNAREGSTVALALAPGAGPEAERVIAYVADSDDGAIYTVDVAGGGRVLARTALRGRPEQVLVLADGRVAATLRDRNAVEVLEPAAAPASPLGHRCLADVPSEPVALAATPDGRTLLVTSGWGRALTALDAATLAPERSVELPREPRSVVVSDDGKLAYVAHVVGAQMSVVDLDDASSEPRPIDLRASERPATPLGIAPPGKRGEKGHREGCQGFALAKSEGGRVYAPMALVDPGEPARASGGYGNPNAPLPPEVSAVAVVDGPAERALTKALFAPNASRSRPARAPAKPDCILPRSAAYANGSLYVTCFGIDALVEYDGRGLDPARFERRRWAVGGGPTGVALDEAGGRAVVWSQFDHVVSVVPLRGGETQTAFVGDPAARPGLDYEFALGRELFHRSGDGRISRDGRACASCHPDGREDAITWATPDGPRQTPMLAGRLAATAPYSWSGQHASLSDHVHTTFQRLGGTGLDEASLGALLAYVNRMPSPARAPAPPARRALIERGREVFASSEAACIGCHADPERALADGQAHDVGSFAIGDTGRAFDTPSLRFLSGTAPYFHDGRYATLQALLDATDSTMGHTAHLSKRDRRALGAYLETL